MAFIFGLITENQKFLILPTEFWASHFKDILIFRINFMWLILVIMDHYIYDASQNVWAMFSFDRQHIEDLEFSDLVSKDLISVPKCHHQPIQDLTRCIASRHDFKITSWFGTSCKTLIKRKRGYKLISFHNIKFSYVLFLIFYFKNINQAVLHFVINQDSIKYKQLKKRA